MNHNPVIIALDVETVEQARALVERIGESRRFLQGRSGIVYGGGDGLHL